MLSKTETEREIFRELPQGKSILKAFLKYTYILKGGKREEKACADNLFPIRLNS